MKKLIIIAMGVLLSMSVFAFGGQGRKNCDYAGKGKRQGQRNHQQRGKFGNFMTKETLKELGLSESNIKKVLELKEINQKEMKSFGIDIQQKNLEVKKLMLEDKKNWTKIERLIKEAKSLEASKKVKALKHKETMSKYVTKEKIQELRAKKRKEFKNNKGNQNSQGENRQNRGNRRNK